MAAHLTVPSCKPELELEHLRFMLIEDIPPHTGQMTIRIACYNLNINLVARRACQSATTFPATQLPDLRRVVFRATQGDPLRELQPPQHPVCQHQPKRHEMT